MNEAVQHTIVRSLTNQQLRTQRLKYRIGCAGTVHLGHFSMALLIACVRKVMGDLFQVESIRASLARQAEKGDTGATITIDTETHQATMITSDGETLVRQLPPVIQPDNPTASSQKSAAHGDISPEV